MKQSITAASGLWLTLLLSACLAGSVQAQTISVQGQGEVEIAPEYATLGVSVTHTDNTAESAQAQVDQVMNDLLAAARALPIKDDSLDAGRLRIQPRYRWDPVAEAQEFQGYEATRELSFRLMDLGELGNALRALSQAGATRVNSPQYGSSQTDAARARALTLAFGNAKADAETLAAAAGMTLGPADNINTGGRTAPLFRTVNRAAAMEMAADAAPQYEPGQLTVSASVSVVFTASP